MWALRLHRDFITVGCAVRYPSSMALRIALASVAPLALTLTLTAAAHAEAPVKGEQKQEEDDVVRDQSVDAYNDLEDAQPGPPGVVELLIRLGWGYVPAEGQTPNGDLEVLWTPGGSDFLTNAQFLVAVTGEHDDIDNTFGLQFGWLQRWVKDGGRDSAVPSIGTLTEFFTPMPFVRNLDAFAPGATTGEYFRETLTVAKYLGPGTVYVNGFVQRQIGNTQICDPGETVQSDPTACDYWAPWTLGVRVGYKLDAIPDRLGIIVDYIHETNEFTTQKFADAEQHQPYDMVELSAMWNVTEHWTLGPGIQLGVNGRAETPTYEAGFVLLYE